MEIKNNELLKTFDLLNNSTSKTNQSKIEDIEKIEIDELNQTENQVFNLDADLEYEKATAQANKDMITAIKIFSRIMKGDSVSLKDQKFLAEKFPDMFHKAQVLKNKPTGKKVKQMTEDEKDSQKKSVEQTSAKAIDIIEENLIEDSVDVE